MEFDCKDSAIAMAFTKEIISYNHLAFYGYSEN